MTNGAAVGYALMAVELMSFTDEGKKKLEALMLTMMDMHTEEEAEEAYRNN